MKRIIAKKTLREFWEKHADSEQYLKTWYETAKNSDWNSPNEVKKTYINASILYQFNFKMSHIIRFFFIYTSSQN